MSEQYVSDQYMAYMQFLDQWRSVKTGNYWRFDPDVRNIAWYAVYRDDGWYWYTADLTGPESVKLSSEVGPFSSWMAAAADCETAHKQDRTR